MNGYYSALPTCSKFSSVLRRKLLLTKPRVLACSANSAAVECGSCAYHQLSQCAALQHSQQLVSLSVPDLQPTRFYSCSLNELFRRRFNGLCFSRTSLYEPGAEKFRQKEIKKNSKCRRKNRKNEENEDDDDDDQDDSGGGSGTGAKWSTCRVLWCGVVPWVAAVKKQFGFDVDEGQLTGDSRIMQNEIMRARKLRESGNTEECLKALHDVLEKAFNAKNELAITNIYEEMGDVSYATEKLDDADKLYREVLGRMIQLHGVTEEDAAFIRVSLRIADILGRKGDRHTAEIGYRHCIEKQEQVTHEHIREQMSVKMQKHYGEPHYTDYELERGSMYSDPIALLGKEPVIVLMGMCYSSYSVFLLDDPKRYAEADELFGKSLQLCMSLYGSVSDHAVVLLNNYGTRCLNKGRFDAAVKYLEDAVTRASQLEKFQNILSGFYCNYAEALFHNGKPAAAIEMTHKAIKLATDSRDARLIEYTKQFLRDLEADVRRKRR